MLKISRQEKAEKRKCTKKDGWSEWKGFWFMDELTGRIRFGLAYKAI